MLNFVFRVPLYHVFLEVAHHMAGCHVGLGAAVNP